MDIRKDALWVLGDSFCTEADNPPRWPKILVNHFWETKRIPHYETKYNNYAEGSMDTQTIIDNWIKLLPYMKENDAVIVCLSDISRTRFPLKNFWVGKLPFNPNPYKSPQINSYFMYGPVGWDPRNCEMAEERTDIPFTDMKEYFDFTRNQNYILATKSYDNSKKDIIEALYKITPCHKKFIYTWAHYNLLDSEVIYQKEWISKNIMNGNWESLDAEWIRTNGQSGIKGDMHLSGDCERMMAEYFIKEFEL